MSLNNIQLGAQQLAQLYGQVLVASNEAGAPPAQTVPPPQAPAGALEPVAAAKEEAEAPAIRSLGGNAKGVLVLVQKENEAFLPEGELNFLTSILKACGLSLADIALVNLAGVAQKNYMPLTEHFKSKKVLLFDVTTAELSMPLNFPLFQVQGFRDCRYLQAPSLHLVEADVALKKNLWVALKNLFAL